MYLAVEMAEGGIYTSLCTTSSQETETSVPYTFLTATPPPHEE